MDMHTKFQIKTTVDITNHNKVTKEDKVKYGQKQNFLTFGKNVFSSFSRQTERNLALMLVNL